MADVTDYDIMGGGRKTLRNFALMSLRVLFPESFTEIL